MPSLRTSPAIKATSLDVGSSRALALLKQKIPAVIGLRVAIAASMLRPSSRTHCRSVTAKSTVSLDARDQSTDSECRQSSPNPRAF